MRLHKYFLLLPTPLWSNSNINTWSVRFYVFELLMDNLLIISATADSEDLLGFLKVLLQNGFVLFLLCWYRRNFRFFEFVGFRVFLLHVIHKFLHGPMFMHFCRRSIGFLYVMLNSSWQRVWVKEAFLFRCMLLFYVVGLRR